MKILLLGCNGQVGWELQRALAPIGELVVLDRTGCNVADLDSVARVIREAGPNVVVNASAYTAVDKAESEADLAHRVNADAVAVMAREVRSSGGWLVHYSTDYVFDGNKLTPYTEDDLTAPVNVYGSTKLAGEEAIRQSGCRHLNFRTSWVYAARGANFAKSMLRLAREREALRVVADQVGAPTSADLIADVTAFVLYRLRLDGDLASRCSGTYNLVASGATNWHAYACFVLEEARRRGLPLKAGPDAVTPITTADYPTPARRPLNSRLDTSKLRSTFDVTLPDWTVPMRHVVDEITQS